MRVSMKDWLAKILYLGCMIPFLTTGVALADDAPAARVALRAVGGTGTATAGGTVLPDLFTGALSYAIPIEVPAGRNGMTPNIELNYLSSKGTSWVGVGWDLEMGAIQRSTKGGVDYLNGDKYQIVSSNSTSDMVDVGNGEYLLSLEGQFSRTRKLVAADGKPYWEVSDKSGRRYLYGETAASRLDDPNDATHIYKWCLDKVIDTNGNYMTLSYAKPSTGSARDGQIYLDQILFAGNGSSAPLSYVKFYRESRQDIVDRSTTNFRIRTLYRLSSIDVGTYSDASYSSFTRIRSYQLSHKTGTSTDRSLLTGIQQYGKDAVLDGAGHITGGTSLPATTFGYDEGSNSLTDLPAGSGQGISTVVKTFADVNGDGRADYITNDIYGNHYITAYNPDGTVSRSTTAKGNGYGGSATGFADINGDGRAEYITTDGKGNHYFTTYDDNFVAANVGIGGQGNAGGPTGWADINGDGRAEYVTVGSNGCHYISFYTAAGTTGKSFCGGEGVSTGPSSFIDINGDGRAEYVSVNPIALQHYITFYNSDGSLARNATVNGQGSTGGPAGWADINGDGRMEYITVNSDNCHHITFYDGDGATTRNVDSCGGEGRIDGPWAFTDLTGDGRAAYITIDRNGTNYITFYNDDGTIRRNLVLTGGNGISNVTGITDFTGTGASDYITISLYGNHYRTLYDFHPDRLVSVANGTGGTTSIAYKPSTYYSNLQLPFSVFTVSSVSTNDGNGNVTVTNYDYSMGYYDTGEQDFRGFNHVKVTGPAGPNGERRISETWFHQGNDTAVVDENSTKSQLLALAKVPTGYMKGKPYRVRVTDQNGVKYLEQTTSYAPDGDGQAPYFNPPLQVDSYTYGGSGTYAQTRTVYTYDGYGNVVREDQYGDLNDPSDDRTIIRNFSPNTTNWITSLPTSEEVYQGIGTTTKVSGTTYYYDDLTDCSATPTNNQTPTAGNLTRVVRWLNGGTSPVVSYAYDPFGNVSCTRDANGNISTMDYDASKTFPVATTNPLSHVTATSYYGVDGIAADNGVYGQVKSATDPNGGVTSYQYDALGRESLVTQADGFWKQTQYLNLGTVGSQRIRVDNSLALWIEAYFDGAGRTIKTRQKGPQSNVLTSVTVYDARGAVTQTSFPYLEGKETPRYKVNVYDALGRVIQSYNSAEKSASTVQACYGLGVKVSIDANNHRRRESTNVMGRLIKVEEYKGTYTTCSTDPLTPYATTKYSYDVLGNLVQVTDAKNNRIQMGYDSLGRKASLSDPDMGSWSYGYDANGNLVSQTDAKSQTITFQYDALNRPIYKVYPDHSNVSYAYDETFSTFPKGRMTTMTDASGTSKYYYDVLGRSTSVVKTIDGTSYTLQSQYDGLGRMKFLQYPDGEVVNYTYNADGTLYKAGNYATYAGYNALGQKGSIAFGNGVTTTLQYYANNNRLYSETVNGPGSQGLLNIAYNYDNVGNITGIVDYLANSNRGQSFSYDELNRLLTANGSYGALAYSYDQIGNLLTKEGVTLSYNSGRPHAVSSTTSGRSYSYDGNGNVTSDGVRTLTYNYDNLPVGYNNGAVIFTYDGAGTRVKKTGPSGAKIYVGKFYECSGGVCGKYIYAGDERIAIKTPTQTSYYQLDHLGSTTVVTDAAGNKIEEVAYYPFGKASRDTGSVTMAHKYTSQELDGETSLYNYGARWYDPEIGKFLSPDTIVPKPADPQSLNRYAYVLNNPLLYTDPTGHSFWKRLDPTRHIKHLFSPDPFSSWVAGRTFAWTNAILPGWAANINKGFQNSFDNATGPGAAIEHGGVLGGLAWTTGGLMTYSNSEGWGAHLSGTYYCFFGAADWEEHGYGKGVTLTAGIGFNYNGLSGGYAASYNVTRGGRIHSTLLIGYGNNKAYGGISYSLDSGRFSGSADISLGNILDLSLPTSTSGGRYQTITSYFNDPDAIHVTGIEGDPGFGGESSSLLVFLDTNMTHSIGVVHDYLMNSFNVAPGNVGENVGLMLPAAFIGRGIGGGVHLGPYSVNEL